METENNQNGDGINLKYSQEEKLPVSKRLFLWSAEHKKKLGGVAVALVMIMFLILFSGRFFQPEISGIYSLKASKSDSQGIAPDSSFLFYSRRAMSEQDIKKAVKFSPDIDFSSRKIAEQKPIFSQALAAGENENGAVYSYELKPSSPLDENLVYKVGINDPNFADHEYGWAFQVKAPFSVSKIHPKNQGTEVPTNSGIEVIFNRENVTEAEKYFEISPRTKGSFENKGDTLIFKPSKLEPQKIYTVTIKKGLMAEGSKEQLGKDFVFSFETGLDEKGSSDSSYFYMYDDFLEMTAEKKPVIQVAYDKKNPNGLGASVYKYQSGEDFIDSYQKGLSWEWQWSSNYRGVIGESAYGKAQKMFSFVPEIKNSASIDFFEIPQNLEPGYYMLDTVFEGKHFGVWLQVTPAFHYIAVTNDKSLVWMYDFLKKIPLDKADVSYVGNDGKTDKLGATTSEGLAEIRTPTALQYSDGEPNYVPKFLKVEKSGYLPVYILANKNGDAEKGSWYWNYISTDRYTYQMTDTVKFWGVLKGRKEDMRNKKINVGIYGESYDAYYQPGYAGSEALARKDVMVSSFDTFSGELPIKGFTPGIYNIKIKIGEEEVGIATFEVLTYLKPVYQITVKSDKAEIYAGDKIKYHVKTDFFDGTPVSGLDLKYSAYWNDSIEGQIKLDENGEGDVEITPAYDENRNYPGDLSITFTPLLSEEGEISGASNVLVFGPNLYLGSAQKKNKDGSYAFSAKVNKIVLSDAASKDSVENGNAETDYNSPDYIGDPASDVSLKAKIVKMTNEKVENGEYYDYIEKVTKKTYSYSQKEETIEEMEGKTDAKGEWNFSKKFPEESSGAYYKIIFSGKDQNDRKMESTTWAYDYSYGNVKDFSVSLGLDGDKYNNGYSLGSKVNLEFNVLEGSVPESAKILYYRYQNNVDKSVIQAGKSFEENFEESFSPSVSYRAVVLGPHGFQETNSVTAFLNEADKKLDINIKPDKESYRPREEVKINMDVKDKDGRAVPAEINVSAVDEALFHILPYNWQQGILESLYQSISTEPVTDASEELALTGKSEMGGCFGRGTEILMSDGRKKTIENIQVGDEIKTNEKEDSPKKISAIVQGISSHYVSEYLVINGNLKVTAEHRLFVNGHWKEAGQAALGDELTLSSGEKKKITSIKNIHGAHIPVYNIIVGKYHTYFAGNYYVHNEEKGGGTRSEFMDTASFQNVRANDQGQASATFKVPDNLTAWRVMAKAYDPKSLKAGEAAKLVKTSIPFFVDATLSSIYLKSDHPQIRLRVFGADYLPSQETEFNVKCETLGLDEAQKSNGNTVYIPVSNLKEGEHEITISAKQGKAQDKLIRKIKVVGNYFRDIESKRYDLSEKLTDISGSQDGLTKLVFSDAGKGKFYPYLKGASYSGGVRVERITASFLAEDLLNKNFGELSAETLDLSGYYTESGGLGLFSYYGDSDLEVSAKIADVAGDYVSKSKLKDYFESSMQDEKTDIHQISKALYGLASLNEPVLMKIESVLKKPETSFEDKIYLNLALEKLGEKEKARDFYLKAVGTKLTTQGNEMYFNGDKDKDKNLKMTANISMLSAYADVKADSEKLWNYISTQEMEKNLMELERIAVAKVELGRAKTGKAKFSYSTSVRSNDIVFENGETYSISLPSDELKTVKFKNISGDIALVSYWEKSKDPKDMALSDQVKIERSYLSSENKESGEFEEGDVVKVKISPKIGSMATGGSYQVVDYLPSGLRPITQTYSSGLKAEEKCDPIWYPDRVENNAVYYRIDKGFENSSNCKNRSLSYYARVVSKGSYESAPALIQSVDNPALLNISQKNRLEIK
jgi:uncharacterized protein YfaS (alpha-2-macroglobulin family)